MTTVCLLLILDNWIDIWNKTTTNSSKLKPWEQREDSGSANAGWL
ncbi:hypothetical protein [Paenibacillus alvei]|nr:hypothetical protein [Paenibacillus alvei]